MKDRQFGPRVTCKYVLWITVLVIGIGIIKDRSDALRIPGVALVSQRPVTEVAEQNAAPVLSYSSHTPNLGFQ